MPAPATPYQPYAGVHVQNNGPGDARPTALQVVKDCNKLGALKGRTVLITGCSSGIGVETAKALYETGATLFLTARDVPKLEKVIDEIVAKAESNKDGPRPQAIALHLDDLDSVRAGAAAFKAKCGGQLNILITNAGVMAAPYGTTKQGFETQIGTNHFAHFLLFQEVKDLLISSAASSGTTSRVVTLSSAGHRRSPVTFTNKAELEAWNKGEGFDKWMAYGQSKTANIWMANSVSRHYAARDLIGLSVHPGGIATELGRHMNEEEWKAIADRVGKTMKSPQQGAATTVWAAVSDHFEKSQGGMYLANVGETAPIEDDSPAATGFKPWAYDPVKEEGFWKLSYEAVGLSTPAAEV